MNFHGDDMNDGQLKADLLAAIFRYLLDKPNFNTVLCESLRSLVIGEGFLGEFCNVLQLSVSEKIGLGLALADAENVDVRTTGELFEAIPLDCFQFFGFPSHSAKMFHVFLVFMECVNVNSFSGQNFCMEQIEKLCGNPAVIDSHEKIQKIILFLYQSEGLAKHVDSFMQMLSLVEFKERPPSVLAPLLSDDLHEDSFSRCYCVSYNLFCGGDSITVSMLHSL